MMKLSLDRRGPQGYVVLVVIAIIAILIGLLVPAVQKVREAAARGLALFAAEVGAFLDRNGGDVALISEIFQVSEDGQLPAVQNVERALVMLGEHVEELHELSDSHTPPAFGDPGGYPEAEELRSALVSARNRTRQTTKAGERYLTIVLREAVITGADSRSR